HQTVDVPDLLRQRATEDHAADGGLAQSVLRFGDLSVNDVLLVELLGQVDDASALANAAGREQLDHARMQGQLDFVEAAEGLAFTLCAGLGLGQIVGTENEIL